MAHAREKDILTEAEQLKQAADPVRNARTGIENYLAAMKVEEIEQQAMALSDGERASLVAKLLHTLPPADTEVSDSDLEQQENELTSGKVSAISHDEFVRRVQKERGR